MLLLLGSFGWRTVHEVVIVVVGGEFSTVAASIGASAGSAAEVASTTGLVATATTAATSASARSLLDLLGSLLLVLLLLFLGLALDLVDLLVQLRLAVVDVPLTLVDDLFDAVIKVLRLFGSHNSKVGELFDDDQVKLEAVLVLDNLLLFLPLVLFASADLNHRSLFSLLL